VQTNAGPLTGQYTQHGGRERRGGKGADDSLGGGGGKGRGKLPREEGEKGNAGKTIGQN